MLELSGMDVTLLQLPVKERYGIPINDEPELLLLNLLQLHKISIKLKSLGPKLQLKILATTPQQPYQL
jgi:hypothetical protein